MNRRNHGMNGETGSRPFAPARGEVYADEGTLILQPSSPYAPASYRAPLESWSEDRGNWSVPAPTSTRSSFPSVPPPARSDRGVMALAGLGSLAIFAGMAAVLLALGSDDKRVVEQPVAIKPPVTTSFAAAPPPAAAPLPVVIGVGGAPVLELPDTTPAAPVVAPSAPAMRAASPAVPATKPKVNAGKSEQQILEDLLEQQMQR